MSLAKELLDVRLMWAVLVLLLYGCGPRTKPVSERVIDLTKESTIARSNARDLAKVADQGGFDQWMEIAERADRQALELDPDSFEALLSMVATYETLDDNGRGGPNRIYNRLQVPLLKRAAKVAARPWDKRLALQAISNCYTIMNDKQKAHYYQLLVNRIKDPVPSRLPPPSR